MIEKLTTHEHEKEGQHHPPHQMEILGKINELVDAVTRLEQVIISDAGLEALE